MQAQIEISIKLELSDAELEKRLLNVTEGDGVDWDELAYLIEFVDAINVDIKHKGKKR